MTAVAPVLAGLRLLGCDPAPFLSRCAIDEKADAVPHSSMMRLWDAASERDPDIGLHVAAAVPLETFDMHAYAFLSSATLREALRRAVRYQRLIHDSTARIA